MIKDTSDIASPPILPTKEIKDPTIKDKIIIKARTFHKIWVHNLKTHLHKQQLVQHFPEHKHINSIKTAKATFISMRTPKTSLTPIFPYLSIDSEVSESISPIWSFASLKGPVISSSFSTPSPKAPWISPILSFNISVKLFLVVFK